MPSLLAVPYLSKRKAIYSTTLSLELPFHPQLMEPNTRIAVVTGGNKGIGLDVCRQLAIDGIMVVLTARDEKRGAEAVEKLRVLGLSNVIFHQLDITNTSSIAKLADFLKTRFGKLDILVNNAGVGGTEVDQELDKSGEKLDGLGMNERLEWLYSNIRNTDSAARECIETNYYGTKHVTEAMLPLLHSSTFEGRIVNVSSIFGLLRMFSNEKLKQELNNIDNLTEERLDEVLDEFLKDFKAGKLDEHGWPTNEMPAYKMAKAALNAYSRMFAKKHPALRINCVHPGYVKTDITMNSGIISTEEGAYTVVRLVLLPNGGPTGAYFDMLQEASFV